MSTCAGFCLCRSDFSASFEALRSALSLCQGCKACLLYTSVFTRTVGNADDYFEHEDFLDIFDFNTQAAASVLGTAVSEMSSQIFREIERTIRTYERDKQAERSQNYDGVELHGDTPEKYNDLNVKKLDTIYQPTKETYTEEEEKELTLINSYPQIPVDAIKKSEKDTNKLDIKTAAKINVLIQNRIKAKGIKIGNIFIAIFYFSPFQQRFLSCFIVFPFYSSDNRGYAKPLRVLQSARRTPDP